MAKSKDDGANSPERGRDSLDFETFVRAAMATGKPPKDSKPSGRKPPKRKKAK